MALNILIVDDSSVMRSMIQKTLKIAQIPAGEIVQAADGKEGLEKLNNHWIDLVLADINMPVMNGEQMIGHMKADPEMREIPIIVVSTEGSATRIERLKRMGVLFIQKPFSPELLRDSVVTLTGIKIDHE
jgi:two-component system chemotaxis response regulator CheY